jgi:hypothetical protein
MLIEKNKIGFIQKFMEDSNSPTGYSIVYLVGSELQQYPCTKEYWDLHLDDEYIFPLITETPKVMLFDENGYACGMRKPEAGVDFYGEYGYGCPKSFGYLYSIEGNKLVIDGVRFNDCMKNDLIAHYGQYALGTFEAIPAEQVEFELTDDLAIYCLDFYGGDRAQKRRDRWYLNDVLKNCKNCYWLNIYDFWNGEGKIDMIVMFRQPPKGPDAKAGNLDETGFTREYRFKEATGSDYADEQR